MEKYSTCERNTGGTKEGRKDVQIWTGSNKISWRKKIWNGCFFPRECAGASTNWCAGGDHQRPQTEAPPGTKTHFILLPPSIIITLYVIREHYNYLCASYEGECGEQRNSSKRSWTSALDQKSVESFTPRRLTHEERSPCTRWIACWEGQRTRFGRFGDGKKLLAPPWPSYQVKYPVLAATLYGAYSVPQNSIFICMFAWEAQLRKRREFNRHSTTNPLHSQWQWFSIPNTDFCKVPSLRPFVLLARATRIWSNGGMKLTGNIEVLREKPVIVPICLRWTRAAEVRDRQLTAWARHGI